MSWPHLIQKLHGIIGVLALAALIHPVLLLGGRKITRRTRWACRGGMALLTISVVAGWVSYLEYRVGVRGWMVVHHPVLHHLWFELKEAAGWLAWLATLGAWALVEWAPEEEGARITARRLFGVAATLCVFAAVVGLIVASTRDLGAMH